ncbi:metallophosphoesterase family protein [Sphingomonas abietis]|uniref:Metallophosphoesterase n=1 Tax=Sphingomonas abietis TaxID=3012344 RepID=A0ABY7NP56_9SPHN|nr:metallophosphoesterase [Sphingomonas abietis]WBO23320.1 metallophosphoesterase [Sphingomonas abietis]
MRTIAQISDLHFGAHKPMVVAHLHAALAAIRPDLVVVSGDLTQRARKEQFAEAALFLERLETEGLRLLVVPGNHDVPMHKPLQRLFWPLRRYKRLIAKERSTWYADPELAVLGLTSAHGLTVKDGRLTSLQARSIGEQFAAAPNSAERVLVTHHPLVPLPGAEDGEIEPALRGAGRALKAVKAAGVHLVLAGHHHAHAVGIAGPTLSIDPAVMVIQAGTATSWRRRRTPNSFNLIRLEPPRAPPGTVQVEEWISEGAAFSCPGSRRSFARSAGDNGGWAASMPSA